MLASILGEMDHGDRSMDLSEPERALDDIGLILDGLKQFVEVLEHEIEKSINNQDAQDINEH